MRYIGDTGKMAGMVNLTTEAESVTDGRAHT
jgi:hypothetical protein